MRDGWTRTTLGEVASWQGGMTPRKSTAEFWEGGGTPWISSKEVQGGVLHATEHAVTELALRETTLRKLPAGSVVLVVRSGVLAHTLPVAYVPFEATVNQDVKAGIAGDTLVARYLHLLLQALGPELLQRYRKTGTTVQSVDFPALLKHEIRVPPLQSQRRIVDLIDAVEGGVAAARERAEAGDALRAALLAELLSGSHEIPDSYDRLLENARA